MILIEMPNLLVIIGLVEGTNPWFPASNFPKPIQGLGNTVYGIATPKR